MVGTEMLISLGWFDDLQWNSPAVESDDLQDQVKCQDFTYMRAVGPSYAILGGVVELYGGG